MNGFRNQWLVIGILVFSLAAIFRPAPVRALAAACLDEAGFWRLVADTRQAVQTESGLPGSPQPVEPAERWREVQSVCLVDGSQAAVEGPLIAQFVTNAKSPEETKALLTWLDRLASTHDLQFARVNAQAGALLKEILARPEFQWKAKPPNPLEEWLNRQVNRFLQWLSTLFTGRSVDLPAPLELLLRLGLPFIAVLLLSLLAFYITTTLRRSFAPAAALPNAVQPGDEALDAPAAWEFASQLANRSDYRGALRYLYLSTLFSLDENGFLRFDKTRTNHEYLAALRGSKTPGSELILAGFVDLVDLFDRVWYGYQPFDQPGYAAYASRVEDLQRLAKAGTGAHAQRRAAHED